MRAWPRALSAALVMAVPLVARAQISPGPLARPHVRLEGSDQCLKCHDRQGVRPEKCLACHTLLAGRIARGQGLHARSDHRDCKLCHVDHQGLEFELVFWGEPGRARFDHALTGWKLEGRHGQLACDDCHRKKLALPAAGLAAGGAGSRTQLGLDRACSSCHADEHRGQFVGRECSACHGQRTWKPATGFDHARAAFRLLGRHASLACERCHPAQAVEGGRATRRYAKTPFAECSSCHEDPHEGRLGPTCSSCHAPDSWRPRASAGFDHDRTRYPLRGRHRALPCEGCHRPGRGHKPARELAHEQCTDCHEDAHAGQLLARSDHGRCEACHDVQGHLPARFGPAEHARTTYPLVGAHLAVPCNACHSAIDVDRLPIPRSGTPALVPRKKSTTMRFRLSGTRCVDCHKDRHEGELEGRAPAEGCEACHAVGAWSKTHFDHGRARFRLTGAHLRLECARCHRRLAEGTARQRPQLRGLALTCEGCHRDPHEGQLTRAGLGSPCERCHTTQDWKPTRFEHDRDAAYALDGAHERLACGACHAKEDRAGVTVVRYRPLGQACKDCHGKLPLGTSGGTS